MTSKLIVALDFNNQYDALSLLDNLDPASCGIKIGSEMYTLFGPDFVKNIVAKQFRVFLDLKFHDIPNTVAASCKAAADLGVWMMNVHAAGGYKMLQAALRALDRYGHQRPLLIAVTILTSMSSVELPEIGIPSTLDEQVNRLARLAKSAELDGVVCSALEAAVIKKLCGNDFLTVTPGIRLKSAKQDDQTRIVTPNEAVHAGSDYLVIGRPITRAQAPQQVVLDILSTLDALTDLNNG